MPTRIVTGRLIPMKFFAFFASSEAEGKDESGMIRVLPSAEDRFATMPIEVYIVLPACSKPDPVIVIEPPFANCICFGVMSVIVGSDFGVSLTIKVSIVSPSLVVPLLFRTEIEYSPFGRASGIVKVVEVASPITFSIP